MDGGHRGRSPPTSEAFAPSALPLALAIATAVCQTDSMISTVGYPAQSGSGFQPYCMFQSLSTSSQYRTSCWQDSRAKRFVPPIHFQANMC